MKRAVVAFVVAIVMLLAVLWSNKGLVGSMSFVPQIDDPEKIDKYSHYLEALLTSVDQLVSMLVTVQLSLFVFAGFALNRRLREARIASITLIILGGIFLLTALISLTLGYTTRIQAPYSDPAWDMAFRECTSNFDASINFLGALCGCCCVYDACGALGQECRNQRSGRSSSPGGSTARNLIYRQAKKRRTRLTWEFAAMHMLSIPLSALILVLEMLSAHAKPCQGKELLD
jgi:hypothetical protein